MEAKDALNLAIEQDIYLYVESGKLKFKSKASGLTVELKALLTQHKAEIIDLLNSNVNVEGKATQPRPAIVKHGHVMAQLSFAQQRLWFIDQLEPGCVEYNMPAAFCVEGPFDVHVAGLAISRIIARHEPLRTVFSEQNSVPVQIIKDEFDFSVKSFDLTNFADIEQRQEIDRLLYEDRNQAFDLRRDLMVRATYLLLSTKTTQAQGILLFNMHHIASDGWSMGIFVNEFVTQYQLIIAGKPDPFPALPISYADYSIWQRQWLEGEVIDKQLSYWKTQLAEAPATHAVPLDFPRKRDVTHHCGVVEGRLGIGISNRLQQIARDYQVTMFMLLHAAVALVLARHSNSQDILVGTPVANRIQAELEPMIGLFINTLVLRTCTDHPSFDSYLAHVRKVNLDAQANQDVSFAQLVEHCQVGRNMDHSPLFQIMFSMNTYEEVPLELDGLRFVPIDEKEVTAKFDLDISAGVDESGVSLFWAYNKTLFTHSHIDQINKHLEQLLASIAEKPQSKMTELPMLSDHEINHLTKGLNEKAIAVQAQRNNILLHELFEFNAKRYPNNTAVVFAEHRYTYKGLNEAANRLAHSMRKQGVNAHSLVGIFVERSVQMMVGILAVLKAGGAFIPLDPGYPRERLQYMLENSKMKHLLSQGALLSKLNVPRDIVVIEYDNPGYQLSLSRFSTSNPPHMVDQNPDNLAYVIYTSGSTGQPKGVMVDHRSVTNHILAVIETFAFNSSDRVLQLASFSFDTFLEQSFAALSVGATLCIAQSSLLEPGRFFSLSETQGITITDLSSAFFAQLVTASLQKYWKKSPIKRIVIGGEALSVASVRNWHSYGNAEKCQIFNAYGPTEAVVTTTVRTISTEDESMVRIGLPIGNRQLYILDRNQLICPFGTVGELYIGGGCLAKGYMNRPDLTNKVFVENPFSNNPNDRLYRTGDLVRYMADGQLTFIGRIDEQVKIRGFRIELGEIEQQLSSQNTIDSSVVIAREDIPGQKRLVAYVKAKIDSGLSEIALIAELRQHLQASLPDYMMPSLIVSVDKWPLTPSGKIDKKSLPIPDANMTLGGYVPPRSMIEKTLVEIQAELLGIDVNTVSVTANFFELGGHSLLAIKYIAEINQRLAFNLDVKSIFAYPKIEDLAAFIYADNQNQSVVTSNLVALLPRNEALDTLYCIPGAGALSLSFKDFALASRDFVNVECFEHKGLFDGGEARATIEDVVSDSLQDLLKAQPQGPYMIAGHSFGGIIAFELVAALEKMGHQARLITLDSYLFPQERNAIEVPMENDNSLNNMSEREIMANVKERLYKENVSLEGVGVNTHLQLTLNGNDREMFNLVDNVKKVFALQGEMLLNYQPEHKLSQDILFLYAEESAVSMSSQLNLVGQLTTGNVMANTIAGGHFSMLKLHAEQISDNVKKFIAMTEIKLKEAV